MHVYAKDSCLVLVALPQPHHLRCTSHLLLFTGLQRVACIMAEQEPCLKRRP